MSEQRERPKGVNRRRFMHQVAGAAAFAGSVSAAAGVTEAADKAVAQDASAADVELTRNAFEALSKGDADVAVRALDPEVRWQAVASREVAEATTLDRRGAGTYLQQMARSITSGERKLEIRSVTAERGAVRVVSIWLEAGRGPTCANIVRFANGKVVSVTEAAQ